MTKQHATLNSFSHRTDLYNQELFCVLDLETTGVTKTAEITEIGAIKLQNSQVLAEFQSLVCPTTRIPPAVQKLTGITDTQVATAPPLGTTLPRFLEFSHGCVLVAHNASFDIGFLSRACNQLAIPWQPPQILDTLTLARQLIPKAEVADYRLATLAAHFDSPTPPAHRALSDAHATAAVLLGLLERLASVRPGSPS